MPIAQIINPCLKVWIIIRPELLMKKVQIYPRLSKLPTKKLRITHLGKILPPGRPIKAYPAKPGIRQIKIPKVMTHKKLISFP